MKWIYEYIFNLNRVYVVDFDEDDLCFTLLKVIGFFIMIFLLIAENQIVSLTVYFAEKVFSLYMQKCFWLQHIMIVHV